MTNAELCQRTGPISIEEARAHLSRFCRSHFRTEGERAIASIPADPRRDSGLRMSAFITQAERAFATIEAARELVALGLTCPAGCRCEASLASHAFTEALAAFDEVRRG